MWHRAGLYAESRIGGGDVPDKQSFVLYVDYGQHLECMGDEEAGQLFKALFSYAESGKMPALSPVAGMAFSFIKAQLDRDAARYEAVCEKNRDNAKRRWGKQPMPDDATVCDRIPADATGCEPMPVDAKHADNDLDPDNDPGHEISSSCAELASGSSPIISLLLNDGSQHYIYAPSVDEWRELYPAVDIMQELRNMKGWLNANPTKRKTKRGIGKFVNSWLAREQDKGHVGAAQSFSASTSNVFAEMLLERGRA